MNEEEVNEKMKEMYEMGREMREKLKKLEEYEAREREIERWKPYEKMEAKIAHMHDCKTTLENAAWLQDEASEICSEFDIDLTTYGRADIWKALEELEAQLEVKEKEAEELHERLEEEE